MPLFLIFLAEVLGKDKNVMKYVFDTDKNMTIGPNNVDHLDGDFFWADISAFAVFSDPDFCYEVMPKIFTYLTENSDLQERDIYITFNDILPHHVGRNGNFIQNHIYISYNNQIKISEIIMTSFQVM